jgi:GntR family transcriptional regulator, rspAB operon transcriptional repressor
MSAGGGEAPRVTLSGGQDLTKGAYSKADAVYGELKEAILSGALEPGSLIDKTDLCERLHVSRFPVSAAVSRLAYDRLVDVAPQHGSFVARISLDDARERLFIRSALEGDIAAEAARRLTRADKDALAANLRQQVAAVAVKDRAKFYALDVAFHQMLTARLSLARSADALESLRVHLERTRRLTMLSSEQLRASLTEHAAIAATIEAGDPGTARDAMKQHLSITAARLEDLAKRQPELFSP